MTHQSVLLQEALEGLSIKPNGVYIDGTFGRGGHSRAILSCLNEQGKLLAIDKDPEAINHANQHFSTDARFAMIQGSFAELVAITQSRGLNGQVDGILLDLGVSSPQIDNPERGFSFMQKGPLDMRMDNQQGKSAADFINDAKEEDMISVFRTYGEERFAGRIARAIISARSIARIETTDVLAEIVKAANPKWEKHKHPATRVFQALRIHVNEELSDLNSCLLQVLDVLKVGGRLAVISFHSLEDRIVKQFMRDQEKGPQLPKEVPIFHQQLNIRFKRIGKAIKPSEAEIKHNVRARSAVLRIGEKIA